MNVAMQLYFLYTLQYGNGKELWELKAKQLEIFNAITGMPTSGDFSL